MKVSVVVTTYNRPDALDRVLDSLARQEVPPLEVMVADDGSGDETARCVAKWQGDAAFPVRHVWQPDDGFRAAAARNRAVAAATGDYLIFLDGDCIAFADFIARHRQLAEAGCFVAGSRILLDRTLTTQVLSQSQSPATWLFSQWVAQRWAGHINRLLPLLRLGDAGWRRCSPRKWRKARTCNLGLWRRDFVAINGFDEDFQGWGHEDADLAVRLIRSGVARKSGQFAVPVIHLWHPESPRALESDNLARMASALNGERDIVARSGMRQYVPGE